MRRAAINFLMNRKIYLGNMRSGSREEFSKKKTIDIIKEFRDYTIKILNLNINKIKEK